MTDKATIKDKISAALPAEQLPLRLDELAARFGADPNSRRFRRAVWQACEAYRDATGVHLRQRDGQIEGVSPGEQLDEAQKRYRAAGNRRRRGTTMAMAAAGRDPALADKAVRALEREAARSSTIADELRSRDAAALRALLLGAKT